MNDISENIINLVSYLYNKKIIVISDIQKSIKKIEKILKINIETYNNKIILNSDHGQISDILSMFSNYMFENGKISANQKKYFEVELINLFSKTHLEINKKFWNIYKDSGASVALDYFYNYNCSINYIHLNDIKKNIYFKESIDKNKLEVTINMCKPEKDPKDIIADFNNDLNKYQKNNLSPKCDLCKENEGYSNKKEINKQNLRLIDLVLNKEKWHLQFSPYSYFYQHSIVVSDKHKPMEINETTICYLIDFINMFPNYIIGSNADLPIVGGSILSHEHFQCGYHHFAIEEAFPVYSLDYADLKLSILDWPMTCIRIESVDSKKIMQKYKDVFKNWSTYNNNQLNILSKTDNNQHNTLNPILRKKDNKYILYIILRNNRTNKKSPEGIFHVKRENQNIKKENIGLIEAMGLAILPSRLEKELVNVSEYVLGNNNNIENIHREWGNELKLKYNLNNSKFDINRELAIKFWNCLKDCCVLNPHNLLELEEIIKISTK